MEEVKDNKALKDIIIEYLPKFNDNVKAYLTENLKIMGEDGIIDKINIHMAFYSEDDEQTLIEKIAPFAIKYDNRHATEIEGNSENIKNINWWKTEVGLAYDSELQICFRKVLDSHNDEWPCSVQMVLVIELKEKEYQREVYLAEVLVDILKEGITDIKDIMEGTWSRKISGDNQISLMERYVNKVFQKWEGYPGLSKEYCCRISYEKNEGRECLGRIYLGKQTECQKVEVKGQTKIIYFENAWNHMKKDGLTSKELENGKIRYIRKMMELCKEDKYLLTCFDKDNNNEAIVDLLGVADKNWLDTNEYTRYIGFDGYGEWNLNESGEMLLLYTKGNYYFSRQSMGNAWKNELNDKGVVEAEHLDKFTEIVERLSGQEHGTCMIVLEGDDVAVETKRLCAQCSRGTQIYGGLDLEGDNLKFVKGLTSLDGALLVDKSGRCHAFGVILDGQAVKQGNPAKGARHNSALTYIDIKAGRGAVVVSEDRTVQIKKSENK